MKIAAPARLSLRVTTDSAAYIRNFFSIEDECPEYCVTFLIQITYRDNLFIIYQKWVMCRIKILTKMSEMLTSKWGNSLIL